MGSFFSLSLLCSLQTWIRRSVSLMKNFSFKYSRKFLFLKLIILADRGRVQPLPPPSKHVIQECNFKAPLSRIRGHIKPLTPALVIYIYIIQRRLRWSHSRRTRRRLSAPSSRSSGNTGQTTIFDNSSTAYFIISYRFPVRWSTGKRQRIMKQAVWYRCILYIFNLYTFLSIM